MSEGILRLFVKDYKQTENPAVRSKCAVAAGWVCIACNVLLCAAKFIIGVISASLLACRQGASIRPCAA